MLVPATVGGSPGWLLGPLRWAGLEGARSPAAGPLFLAGMALALVLHVMVVRRSRSLTPAWAAAAIVAGHVLFALAPPLLSQDAFSYLAYARLDALYGLDPYSNAPLAAPGDPAFAFAGSKAAPSVYGPVFTLLTRPLAALDVPLAFWTIKASAALASLAVVGLVVLLARRLGRPPVRAALALGLHPLVLVHVVGGAHNDALVVLVVLCGVTLWAHARGVPGVAIAAAAVGLKASAGLVAPFLALRTRGPRAAAALVAGLAGTVAIGFLAFGPEALLPARLLENQASTSSFSFPHRLAGLLGALGPGEAAVYRGPVRLLALLALGGVLVALARRTWRGADPVTAAGWAILAALAASAWLVPWYIVWLVPLAALAGSRRLGMAAVALSAWMLPIAVPL